MRGALRRSRAPTEGAATTLRVRWARLSTRILRGKYPLGVRRFVLLVALAALVGCSGGSSKTASVVKVAPPAPLDPWVLTTLDGSGGEPAYLSNGLIGVRMGRNGGGLGPDREAVWVLHDRRVRAEGGGEDSDVAESPARDGGGWAIRLYKGGHDYDFMKSGGTPLDPRGGTRLPAGLGHADGGVGHRVEAGGGGGAVRDGGAPFGAGFGAAVDAEGGQGDHVLVQDTGLRRGRAIHSRSLGRTSGRGR